MLKPFPNIAHVGVQKFIEEVSRLRSEDILQFRIVKQNRLKGRDRTGVREAPTAYDNILDGDNVGDVLQDGTYKYELINDSGVLKWDRRTLNISW